MRRARWAALAAIAVLLAGCGSGDADQPRLTQAQALTLLAPLAEAKAAAPGGRVDLVERAMRGFRANVARLRREGALTRATAAALRTGALRVVRRVRSDNPEPPAQTTTQVAPASPPEEDEKDEKEERKKGEHGKQKGKKR